MSPWDWSIHWHPGGARNRLHRFDAKLRRDSSSATATAPTTSFQKAEGPPSNWPPVGLTSAKVNRKLKRDPQVAAGCSVNRHYFTLHRKARCASRRPSGPRLFPTRVPQCFPCLKRIKAGGSSKLIPATCPRAYGARPSTIANGTMEDGLELYLRNGAIRRSTTPRRECHPPDQTRDEELALPRFRSFGPNLRHPLHYHRIGQTTWSRTLRLHPAPARNPAQHHQLESAQARPGSIC